MSERRAGQDGHATGWTWQGRSQRSICVCRAPPREPPFPLPDISSVFRSSLYPSAQAAMAGRTIRRVLVRFDPANLFLTLRPAPDRVLRQRELRLARRGLGGRQRSWRGRHRGAWCAGIGRRLDSGIDSRIDRRIGRRMGSGPGARGGRARYLVIPPRQRA